MDAVALLLVLAAAGFHAGWNRLLHGVQDRVAAMATGGLVAAVLLLPALLIAPPGAVAPLIPLSAAAEVGYALSLAAAYRRGALSVAYPIGRGTAPLLVTVGAWLALGQGLRPATVAGAAALALGLVLVASSGGPGRRGGAVPFAGVTGCCIAAYSVVDARAVRAASPPAYLGAVLGLQGLALALLLHDPARLRAAAGDGVRIGAGMVVAYLLVLLAFRRADAGAVATLREISVLVGLLLARAERPGARAWWGGVLVVAGAALAAL